MVQRAVHSHTTPAPYTLCASMSFTAVCATFLATMVYHMCSQNSHTSPANHLFHTAGMCRPPAPVCHARQCLRLPLAGCTWSAWSAAAKRSRARVSRAAVRHAANAALSSSMRRTTLTSLRRRASLSTGQFENTGKTTVLEPSTFA